MAAIAIFSSSAVAQSGPIAAYSFDEGEGEVAEDLTGDGHDATIKGADWTTHGRYGGALEFDGEDDVLKVPDSPDLDFSEEFTLEAWVRPSGAEHIWEPLIVKQFGEGKGSYKFAYFLYAGQSQGLPYGGTENSEGKESWVTGPAALAPQRWSHVALTFDGDRLRIYVDGVLVDTDSNVTVPPQVTDGELQIGGSTEHEDFFDGRIDEVRIYNRALDAGEVSSDVTPPASPPVWTRCSKKTKSTIRS